MGDCADEGQGDLANAQGKLAAANKDQLAKQATAGTTLDTKKTACTASVAFNVNLDTLESSKCYDTTKEQSYINAKRTCTSATSAMTKADKSVTIAKSIVKDGQQDHDNAVAAAAKLKSACHCRVKKEQAQAWTAASEATAAHAADWKQAHEVICALDQTTSCDKVPDCPAVEQVTLSNDVSSEECTQAQSDGCDKLSEYCVEKRVQSYAKGCLDSYFPSPEKCVDAAKHINQCGVKLTDHKVMCCPSEGFFIQLSEDCADQQTYKQFLCQNRGLCK